MVEKAEHGDLFTVEIGDECGELVVMSCVYVDDLEPDEEGDAPIRIFEPLLNRRERFPENWRYLCGPVTFASKANDPKLFMGAEI